MCSPDLFSADICFQILCLFIDFQRSMPNRRFEIMFFGYNLERLAAGGEACLTMQILQNRPAIQSHPASSSGVRRIYQGFACAAGPFGSCELPGCWPGCFQSYDRLGGLLAQAVVAMRPIANGREKLRSCFNDLLSYFGMYSFPNSRDKVLAGVTRVFSCLVLSCLVLSWLLAGLFLFCVRVGFARVFCCNVCWLAGFWMLVFVSVVWHLLLHRQGSTIAPFLNHQVLIGFVAYWLVGFLLFGFSFQELPC